MLVLFIWLIIILIALILTFPFTITVKGGLYGLDEKIDIGVYLFSVRLVNKKLSLVKKNNLIDKKEKKHRSLNARGLNKALRCLSGLVERANIGFWGESIEPHQIALLNSFSSFITNKGLYFGKGEERITFDIILCFSIIQIIIDYFAILKAQKEGK